MDTQKKIAQQQSILSQSDMLGQRVLREWKKTGRPRTKCPKCGKLPEITTYTNGGERIVIRCDCGYIAKMIIVM